MQPADESLWELRETLPHILDRHSVHKARARRFADNTWRLPPRIRFMPDLGRIERSPTVIPTRPMLPAGSCRTSTPPADAGFRVAE